jgi:hypothetical protein
MKVSKEHRQPGEAEATDAAVPGAAGPAKGEEEGAGEGGTVVVGVRADAESRALLTWAFVNAVAAGDRVVAVHVVLASAVEAAAAVDFDGMLAVYEGFCNLKQVRFLAALSIHLSPCPRLVRGCCAVVSSRSPFGRRTCEPFPPLLFRINCSPLLV